MVGIFNLGSRIAEMRIELRTAGDRFRNPQSIRNPQSAIRNGCVASGLEALRLGA
jgi:hypothetical protein